MIKLDNENYNRKIKLTESINNRFDEDKDFEDWFDNEMQKAQQEIATSPFSDIKNVKVHSLDVPLEKQDGKHTYTYVEDFKTGRALINYCIQFFNKERGFTVTAHKQTQGIKTIFKERNEYEPLYDSSKKFLSNGIFVAYINEKSNSKDRSRININVSINSIKIDSPEFDSFDNGNKFVFFIESNALRAKHVNEEAIEEMFNKFYDGLYKKLNTNWDVEENIKTNAEIDAEG